jgi:succinate dehydrogenase / fumarate reductase cytochrome b subunit
MRVFNSSIGTKLLIGASGLGLVIYLLIHVTANLMVFGGADAFNGAADRLERLPLLTVIEVGLLLVFLLHIVTTIAMFLGNQQARPVRYVKKRMAGPPSRKSFASTTMIVSGLWLLIFLIIHVKAFKFSPTYEWAGGGKDFYRLEMDNFRNPIIAGFYVLSMLVVGLHLWHGPSSALQSLGLDTKKWTPPVLTAGRVLAVAIAGAFIAITVWAYIGSQA